MMLGFCTSPWQSWKTWRHRIERPMLCVEICYQVQWWDSQIKGSQIQNFARIDLLLI